MITAACNFCISFSIYIMYARAHSVRGTVFIQSIINVSHKLSQTLNYSQLLSTVVDMLHFCTTSHNKYTHVYLIIARRAEVAKRRPRKKTLAKVNKGML